MVGWQGDGTRWTNPGERARPLAMCSVFLSFSPKKIPMVVAAAVTAVVAAVAAAVAAGTVVASVVAGNCCCC